MEADTVIDPLLHPMYSTLDSVANRGSVLGVFIFEAMRGGCPDFIESVDRSVALYNVCLRHGSSFEVE